MDRYVEAVTTLADSASKAGDAALASTLLVRLATIAEQDLHDDRRSAALYERVVDLDVRTPEVLAALDRVYERLGDDGQRARILAMRIEAETDGKGPVEIADRAAMVVHALKGHAAVQVGGGKARGQSDHLTEAGDRLTEPVSAQVIIGDVEMER